MALGLRRAILGVFILVGLFASSGASWGVSLKKELHIGEEGSKAVEKEMPLSKNQKWQDDIAALGAKLVPFVKRTQIPYHFHVVADKEKTINAFALPGGYIYFTEHMWKILTPDERAGVMAHEITHCDLRHGIDANSKQQQRMLWTLPLLVLGGGMGAEAWMVGNMAVSARYSRKAERQADEEGILLMKRAGLNPAGSVTSLKKLLSIENDSNRYEVSALFADHPDTQKRVDYLSQKAMTLGAKPSELELLAVDDPARYGNVIRKVADLTVIYARTSIALQYNEKVLIKKLLWDEDKKSLEPKAIAEAIVLTPGKFPVLVLTNYKDYNFSDVMVGDGIYPFVPGELVPPVEPVIPPVAAKTEVF